MSVADVASFLRVPEEVVRQLAALGQLPGRLIGTEWRFWQPTVVAWLSGPSRGRLPDPDVPDRQRRGSMALVAESAWDPGDKREAEEFLSRLAELRGPAPEGSDDFEGE